MELFFHTFRLTVNLPIPVYAHMETLKRTIDQLNEKLQEINSGYSSSSSIKPPNIGLDLIKSSKSKNEAKVEYTINYNLLLDGIHPGRELSKLWLYRLLKLKNKLENSTLPNL